MVIFSNSLLAQSTYSSDNSMLVTAVNKEDKTVVRNAAQLKLNAEDWIISPPEEIFLEPSKYWIIEGGSIRVATQDEKDVIDFPELKIAKFIQLDSWWKSIEDTGITVQSPHIVLGVTPNDITLMNGVFTTAQSCVALGIKTQSDTFQLHDFYNEVHLFTLSQLTTILLSYSQQRSALHATYKAKYRAIDAATTKGQLDSIGIP